MKRITLMNIFKKILNSAIELLCPHKLGRKTKQDNNFYINRIFRVFFFGECWNNIDCGELDQSTVRKRFYKWDECGIFDYAYSKLFKMYSNNRTFKHLFIDSSIIENFNCSDKEYIDFCYKMKTKKTTKLSLICDHYVAIMFH